VCWEAEESLTENQWVSYMKNLMDYRRPAFEQKRFEIHATWQQRATDLIKVKGGGV